MGDALKKAQAGQKLEIPAEAYNAFVDAVRYVRERRHDVAQESSAPFRQSGIIKVRNDSGTDRERFDVLGISQPIISPGANLPEFKNQVAVVGVVPQHPEHFGNSVVLLEPLSAGGIGRGWISGVCPTRLRVDAECHEYADIEDDNAAQLVSLPAGSARILWREGGLGPQWAVVRLANPMETLWRFKLTDNLKRCGSAGAVRIMTDGDLEACVEDCSIVVHDALGVAEDTDAGGFGWAKWCIDARRFEVVQLGAGCCEPSSSSGSSFSSTSGSGSISQSRSFSQSSSVSASESISNSESASHSESASKSKSTSLSESTSVVPSESSLSSRPSSSSASSSASGSSGSATSSGSAFSTSTESSNAPSFESSSTSGDSCFTEIDIQCGDNKIMIFKRKVCFQIVDGQLTHQAGAWAVAATCPTCCGDGSGDSESGGGSGLSHSEYPL